MMKKIALVLLGLVLVLGFTGCDSSVDPPVDTEAPVLGEVTLENDTEGNLVLKVSATDNEGLATLEVDHNLEGTVPEFTVGTEDMNDPTSGARSTFADGTWTLSFGEAMSNSVRDNANSEMTFHFVITDVNGNQFGNMDPTTTENTKVLEVPAVPVDTEQEVTRTMAAFTQLMNQDELPNGVTNTVSGNTYTTDFDNATTVYSGDTYAFDGFMSVIIEDDNSGSISMELTASSTSLEGDIVIVFSMSVDSAENFTINTATINGIDYSEDESLWGFGM